MNIKWKITKFAGNDNTVKNVKYEATSGSKSTSGWATVNVPVPSYGVSIFNDNTIDSWVKSNFDAALLAQIETELA